MNLFSTTKNLSILGNLEKKNYLKRLIQFIIGCFIVSVAYNVFIVDNKIVPGGVGGIAVIVNNLLGIDNTITIIVLNIVLLILSFILLGVEKTRKSMLGTILLPLFIKLTEHFNVWLEIDNTNILLSVLIGGILYGIGAGLVFKAGFTTGGTDILNQIISKFAKISIGKSMLICDGTIVLSSGIFFGLDIMLYSVVILYIISYISDRIILGISDNKIFYIVTDMDKEIKDFILNKLNHGVTVFKAKGGYKKVRGNVLMTVLPTKDYYILKTGIKKIDKSAFFIVTDSYELYGGEWNE